MIRHEASLDHITPYDRLAFSDVEVEHFLVTGEHRRELAAFFGEQEYQELVKLAQRAHATPLAPDAARVLIVPGIMGSQLGTARKPPLPNDVLWIDPVDISVGRLAMLRMAPTSSVVSLGIVLYTYLRLKLHLRIGGFQPVCHHYDWRLDIHVLGQQLADRIRSESNGPVMIVAHSMGGLVVRAALAQGLNQVRKVVLLGTPNTGSFAVVQALRGTYAVVRKIARLAEEQSAELLASEVFNTFPSLYQLLPRGQASNGLDLLDPESWPEAEPKPDLKLLARARSLGDGLAAADGRFSVVIGVGQETVTAASRRNNEFVYTITRAGDGTVPAVCAALPGARTYYTRVAHSELTRNAVVAGAVIDLLRGGATRKLDTRWSRGARAQARITDSQLRRTHLEKVDLVHMEPDERRIFLQTLNEPPQLRLRVPASKRKAARRNVRPRKHR